MRLHSNQQMVSNQLHSPQIISNNSKDKLLLPLTVKK
jgi:hypothetical protein